MSEPKCSWYEFACISEYSDKKMILYCEKCEQIFFIRNMTWKRLEEKTLFTLTNLTSHARCCEDPNWFFVTLMFTPRREIGEEVAKNFLSALDEEASLLYLWMDIL